jgi:2-oxoglutarate dehydrogenase E1 component
LFERYQADPESIDVSWRYFFEGMEYGDAQNAAALASKGSINEELARERQRMSAEAKVAELIAAYRNFGKVIANINPLAEAPTGHPLLALERFGLSEADMDRSFTAGGTLGLGQQATLRQILQHLRDTYCSSIAAEVSHISDPAMQTWLQELMEKSRNREAIDAESKKFILRRLAESEGFERFLGTRYVAQKRFSLEGGEALIPTIDRIIETAAELGTQQLVIGMAHRGRLNMLANTFYKKPRYIFSEFEDSYELDETSSGDVKYHKGYSADITTRGGKSVHLSLAHNPSHLEVVNPVVEGITRSKQRVMGDIAGDKVIPIQIHGDAAFAGQGSVYETLGYSELPGFTTGGTVHIVINNQIGFTTSPEEARSSSYATDLAKMLQVPIFHVNGDDPEALWWVAKLAVLFRAKFKRGVFIDLLCYRRWGHNEGDEPAFTQPLMYNRIRKHPTTRALYGQRLMLEGVITSAENSAADQKVVEDLTVEQRITQAEKCKPFESSYDGLWKHIKPATASGIELSSPTTVDAKVLLELGARITTVPAHIRLNPKIRKFVDQRIESLESREGFNWGFAEALAFASLVKEGHPVRLTGQDSERGTFSHRHAVLFDHVSGERYNSLMHISEDQAPFLVKNSTLSEAGVLGFEYGWSLTDPDALVIWEAQFGDFANSAQVIIDQFISSSEAKWKRASGLVLFLPHGHEGQGPEHSSARLERFLQLCGENNFAVCNFTTASNLFHALRRQVKRNFRKPLVVMTPKSLLRHAPSFSKLEDFTERGFQYVYDDPRAAQGLAPDAVERVLLCSGKIYYELHDQAVEIKDAKTAIVRIEQLYPFPVPELHAVLSRYKNAKEIVWVQEEPRNQGAWTYIFNHWCGGLGHLGRDFGHEKIFYVGRKVAAAPAAGSLRRHKITQQDIVQTAFAKLEKT